MGQHRTPMLPTVAEYSAAYYEVHPMPPVMDVIAERVSAQQWRAHAVELHHDTPASQARNRATLSAAVTAHLKYRRTAA